MKDAFKLSGLIVGIGMLIGVIHGEMTAKAYDYNVNAVVTKREHVINTIPTGYGTIDTSDGYRLEYEVLLNGKRYTKYVLVDKEVYDTTALNSSVEAKLTIYTQNNGNEYFTIKQY